MKKHELKCWPEHFAAVTHPDPTQRKTAELRLNDRDYEVGDWLIMREYDPQKSVFTGFMEIFYVTHILSGGPWLSKGYVMLSLLPREELIPV